MHVDAIPTDLIVRRLDALGERGHLSYDQRQAGLLDPETIGDRRQHVRSNRWLMGGILAIFLMGAVGLALALIAGWTLPGFLIGFVGGGVLIGPVLLWRFHRLSQIEALYDVLHATVAEAESPVSAPVSVHG